MREYERDWQTSDLDTTSCHVTGRTKKTDTHTGIEAWPECIADVATSTVDERGCRNGGAEASGTLR